MNGKKIVKIILKGLFWLFFLQIILIFTLKFVPVRTTSYMMTRPAGHYLKTGEKMKDHHKWVPLDKICPEMKIITILAEDTWFTEHCGIDLQSVKTAFKFNASSGHLLHGASTITQQTAKNVFLYPRRSFIRKALEAEISLLLELIWGKKRILEVYLNSVEMGEHIFGVESCAEIIFGCTASTLTKEQCAIIISMLPYERKNYSSPHPWSYRMCENLLHDYDIFLKKLDRLNKKIDE